MKEASDLKNLHILVTISTSIQRNLTWQIFIFLDISKPTIHELKILHTLGTHEALEQTFHNLKTFTLLASIAQEYTFLLINFTFLDIITWNQKFVTILQTLGNEALEQRFHNYETFNLLASIAQESTLFLINFYWWVWLSNVSSERDTLISILFFSFLMSYMLGGGR